MKRRGACKLAVVALSMAVWSSWQFACVSGGGGATGLSPDLPGDVKTSATQEDFDNYAWRMFVALNWPTKDGAPDRLRNMGYGRDAPRVWELYTDPIDIFKGASPTAQPTPAAMGVKQFYMTRKRVERLDAGMDTQAASLWPLVDQQRNFATYEIRFNNVEKEYIEKNGLTTAQGLLNFNQPIDLPDDSIEVKAAWRLFPENIDRAVMARYYTRPAVINVPAEQSATGKAYQINGAVGLVGLHIARKTKNQPRWIWATFEHVDNYEVYYKPLPGLTPTFSSGKAPPDKLNRQPLRVASPTPTPTSSPASTSSPSASPSPASSPSPSTSPSPSPLPSSSPSPSPTPSYYVWSATQPTAGQYEPTEVARCPNEIAPSASNARWQETLAGVEGSPWQFYRLNVVQWFDASNNLLPKNGSGYAIARNSVLETYLLGDQSLAGQVPAIPGGPTDPKSTLGQTIIATTLAATDPAKTGPNTWSSCVLCHQMAAYGTIMTDYSFVWRSYLPPTGH